MTVSELINKLNEYPQDIRVAVQYRDSGGDYIGFDEDIEPWLYKASEDDYADPILIL